MLQIFGSLTAIIKNPPAIAKSFKKNINSIWFSKFVWKIKATVKVNKAIIDAENRVLYPIINNMENKTSRIIEGKNYISGTP